MTEYIEREQAFYARPEYYNPLDDYKRGWNACNSEVYKNIKEIPSADVAPVVHGRWEFIRNYAAQSYYRCNLCHRVEVRPRTDCAMFEDFPYCHCGAKMDFEVSDGQ